MVLVRLHDEIFRGNASKNAGRWWRAADWSIGPHNNARIIPDNWSILNE